MAFALIPWSVLRRLGLADEVVPHANVVGSHLLLLVLALWLPWHDWTARIPHLCIMRELLGMPCPGCGMTTSLARVCEGLPSFAPESNGANTAGVVVHPAGWWFVWTWLLQTATHGIALGVPSLRRRCVRWSERLGTITVTGLLIAWIFRLSVG